jgi:acyl-coenzyme A thioesterase PaaI-like protein
VSGRPGEGETRLCEFVFPSDTNHLGTLYGGTLMAWMDKAAAVAGLRRSGSSAVVTVAVEALEFRVPIHHGELVELVARVESVGRTSMKVRVEAHRRTRPAAPASCAPPGPSRWSRSTTTGGPPPSAEPLAGPSPRGRGSAHQARSREVEMHGVIVQVKIDSNREEEARRALHEMVVPRAKALAGFSGGTWLRALGGDAGRGVLLFESEEAARAAVDEIRSQGPPPGVPVTLEAVDVYEVLAQA